jgi:hypothetical protein
MSLWHSESVRVKRLVIWLVVFLTISVPLAALAAQRGGGGFFTFGRGRAWDNVPYDGRFTFARIRYNRGFGRRGGGGWAADYPLMEQNLTEMLTEITAMNPHTTGSNVHDLDDPELLKYPVSYLSEPGYWYPTDAEVRGLQEYLAKGGFLIVDDFHFDNEWWVFETAMRKVLPDARIDRLDISHPVFNSFFNIKSLHVPYPGNLGERGLYGEFFGIHEDNDTSKRLKVVINYNMDVGDYVEWAQSSRSYSFEPTNEAYKFMINYLMYGLTH